MQASGPREAVKVEGRLNVVLDCWGCWDRAPSGDLLFTLQRPEAQDRGDVTFAVAGGPRSGSLTSASRAVSSRRGRDEGLSLRGSLTRTLKVAKVVKVCLRGLIPSQRSQLQTASLWGLEYLHVNLGEGRTFGP